MTSTGPQKVTAEHLKRRAFLYVRQSSPQQVMQNTESTRRQYDLRGRAVALGWASDQVTVIDSDQGQSGASASDREGFQRLMTEVSMNRAGIVMGLEVSRLARNSSDWCRMLEICALTETLLLDEDGVYDPAEFNDRLLLGLKGTMSEAELHVLRARMRGGLLQKARRGELGGRLPAGFVYGPEGGVKLDPDRQIQDTIRYLFATFRRVGSGIGVVKVFRREGLKFPRQTWGGANHGEILWDKLSFHRVNWVLKSPRYAGAYCYGRSRHKKAPDGRTVYAKALPREQWVSLIQNAHPGYISWEEFEENLRRLQENSRIRRCLRERTPPREGPALLQGLAICGRCGRRMTLQYHKRRGQLYPDYVCCASAARHGGESCQRVPGRGVDEAVGRLLLEAVTPMNLEVALSVQKELKERVEEVDRIRRQKVERIQHETNLARRRYIQVDPDNRLVAEHLEGDWNQKLRELREAQEEYERQREADHKGVDEETKKRIMALATDFPRVWNDPATPARERKRMAQLLLEDVALNKREDDVVVQIRFKGGATRTLNLPRPLPFCQLSKTKPEVIEAIDQLLGRHSQEEIAEILNTRGFRSGDKKEFHAVMVGRIRSVYGLRDRRSRLREAGLLTTREIARALRVRPLSITYLRKEGIVKGHRSNYRTEYLYEPPTEEVIVQVRKRTSLCRSEGARRRHARERQAQ